MWEIVFILLAVAINAYILNYLYYLEKNGCKCAMNWRRIFIMVFIGFSLLLSILSLFKIDVLTASIILSVFAGLSIANVVIILQYVYMLKKEKCACSDHLAREILQFIAALYAFFYIMLLIVLFYSGFQIANIISLAKQLSTNNPAEILKVMNKTLSSATNSFKKTKK